MAILAEKWSKAFYLLLLTPWFILKYSSAVRVNMIGWWLPLRPLSYNFQLLEVVSRYRNPHVTSSDWKCVLFVKFKSQLTIFPHKARFSRGRRPRPSWISVKTIYWSGDFQERFFLFDPSLTSGMSAALMQGHCLRRRPCIKQHMSGGREFHRKYYRQLPPHLTRHETLHAAGLD